MDNTELSDKYEEAKDQIASQSHYIKQLLSQRDELVEVLSDFIQFIQINDSIIIPSCLSVGYFSKVTKAHNLLTKINTKP